MHTNFTYQPQPALCYISKTTGLGMATGTLSARNIQFNVTTLGVTTGWLLISNMQFNVTTLGVTTGRLQVAIFNSKFTEQERAT